MPKGQIVSRVGSEAWPQVLSLGTIRFRSCSESRLRLKNV
nr:MAG TPA: hypothetical protein [Caudoviricetes sp.]